MSLLQRYRAYIKDNPHGYWFKRKWYGWGWTPATWQGWLTLAIFLGIFLWVYVPFVSRPESTTKQSIWFVIEIVVWAVALVGICAATGESPRWQWGAPRKSSNKP